MILSTETKADIRRLHDIWLARLAFEYRCEQTDVLAAIETEAPKPSPADLSSQRPTEAKTSAEEPSPDGSGGVQDRCESTPPPNQDQPIPQPPLSADPVASEPPHTGSDAAGGDTPPSSPATSVRARVAALHVEHPEFTRQQAWEHLGITEGSLAGTSHALKIKWASAPAIIRPERPAPPPPAPMQRPAAVVVPPAGKVTTILDRVRVVHQQHPTWTAPMIAKHLGANANSVSTLLATVRRGARGEAPPPPTTEPEFKGRADMLEHYDAVAKRLGKAG